MLTMGLQVLTAILTLIAGWIRCHDDGKINKTGRSMMWIISGLIFFVLMRQRHDDSEHQLQIKNMYAGHQSEIKSLSAELLAAHKTINELQSSSLSNYQQDMQARQWKSKSIVLVNAQHLLLLVRVQSVETRLRDALLMAAKGKSTVEDADWISNNFHQLCDGYESGFRFYCDFINSANPQAGELIVGLLQIRLKELAQSRKSLDSILKDGRKSWDYVNSFVRSLRDEIEQAHELVDIFIEGEYAWRVGLLATSQPTSQPSN